VAATFQIRRTRPCGRVLHIWVVEGGEKGAGVWKTIPDTKNATLCHIWVVEGGGKGARISQTRKRDPRRFRVWGVENDP